MTAENDEFKYFAFISYSHQDKEWGDWLHKALETYKVPRALVGTIGRDGAVPKRAFPIFRDREELPTSADLGENIGAALRASRYLIVICSPRSAQSQWVNEEIRAFKAMGRENRVLCLIVDGEPNTGAAETDAFPDAVKFTVDAQGRLTDERTEPIAADARDHADGKESAKLKLLAGLLGVNFDKLAQRDKKRKQRQRLIAGGAGLSLLAAASAGLFMIRTADLERRISAAQTAAQQAVQHADNDKPLAAMAALAAAVPDDLIKADRLPDKARGALYRLMAANFVAAEVEVGNTGFTQLDYDTSHGLAILTYEHGLQVHDASSALELRYRIDLEKRLRGYHIDAAAGHLLIMTGGELQFANDGPLSTTVYDLLSGERLLTVPSQIYSQIDPLIHNDSLIAVPVVHQDDQQSVSKIILFPNRRNLRQERSREIATVDGIVDDLALNQDGTVLTLINRDHEIVFIDMNSGQQLASVQADDPVLVDYGVDVSADGKQAVINKMGVGAVLIDLTNAQQTDLLSGVEGCGSNRRPLTMWVTYQAQEMILLQNCSDYFATELTSNKLFLVQPDGQVHLSVYATREMLAVDEASLSVIMDRGSDGVLRAMMGHQDQRLMRVTGAELGGVTAAQFTDDADHILTYHNKGVMRRMKMERRFDIVGSFVDDGKQVSGYLSPDHQVALIISGTNLQQVSLASSDRLAQGTKADALPQARLIAYDDENWAPGEFVDPVMGRSYWALLFERRHEYGKRIMITPYADETVHAVSAVADVEWFDLSGTGQHVLVTGKNSQTADSFYSQVHLFVVNKIGDVTDSTEKYADMIGVSSAVSSPQHQTVLTAHFDRSVRLWHVSDDGVLSDPVVIFDPDTEPRSYPDTAVIASANRDFAAIVDHTNQYTFPGNIADAPDDRLTIIAMADGAVMGTPRNDVPRRSADLSMPMTVQVVGDGSGAVVLKSAAMTGDVVLITNHGDVQPLGDAGAGLPRGALLDDRLYLSDAGDLYDLATRQFVARDIDGLHDVKIGAQFWIAGGGVIAINAPQLATPAWSDQTCLIDKNSLTALYCSPGKLLEGGIAGPATTPTLVTIDGGQIIRHTVPPFDELRDHLLRLVTD